MADLNKVLNYTLTGQQVIISIEAQKKIDDHIIVDKDDWGKSFSTDFIGELKTDYCRKQGHKCAYCRIRITADGYTEPVEHITPRLLKPHWMFVPHNLAVSCGGCNSNKGTKNMLARSHTSYGDLPSHCPNTTTDYRIFNPHYDNWNDHFEIEDSFLIKPKANTKGPFTYTELGMSRYTIIVEYILMLDFRKTKDKSIKTLTQRIRREKNPDKLNALRKALESIQNTIMV